ncbi:MAG: FtsX-like permease family protein, partial [Planctomycetota bacterium]|nr:FtsX-like permease family protein [Planctomycetota bacterium]
ERTSEIGLWKALGAKRAQILLAFISEAVVISGIGALAGVILGLLGNWILNRLIPALPPITPLWAIFSAIGVAMGVGIIFGVLPARRAAAIPAVDALRKGR